jgi:prepilin-type N-terminal cleavage/methylation domain-containing protein
MKNVPIFSRGYTLLELMIVVIILATIAAIAVPGSVQGSDQKLRLAAAEVAGAIRFARSEAMRTGEGYGVTVDQATQTVTVNRYDLGTAPVAAVGIPINPVTKKPYDYNVYTKADTRGVTISNSQDAFDFSGFGRRKDLIFDRNGIPKWLAGAGPTTHLLSDGTVLLSYGNQQLSVRVAPITGRVTEQ